MRIVEISHDECKDLLNRVSVGRLACSHENQPYIVPVCFAYEPEYIYVFSTLGQKIEWMRQNPKVCLQADEIASRSNWTSVVVTGTYLELREPYEKEHARERLAELLQLSLRELDCFELRGQPLVAIARYIAGRAIHLDDARSH